MKKRLNKLFIKDESGHYKYVYGQKEIAKYTNVDYKLSKILIVFYSFVLFCICFGLYFLYLDRHDFYILKDSITVDSGSIYQLSILPKNNKYFSYSDYVFSIKDNKIAKIDQNGTIYALKNGKTKVRVRYKNSFIHKKVTLIVDNVNVREIAFNDKDIVVYRNESIKLKPNINNREDIVTTLNYISSDPSVLTVDNFGNVTALRVGSAKIIVESSDGTKAETTIKVEGNNKSIVGLSIKEKDVRINPYETKQLTLVTLPSGSSEDVTWTSSNPKVVSVDNNGLINLKELGTAMRAFGFELNDIELQDLMKEYDKDGNNSLDLSEFIDLLNKKKEEQKEELDHFETFQLLDINDDGFLSRKNLQLLFENIGLNIDDDMLDGFFQYVDKDNDKKINLEEFINFMQEK